MHQCLCNYIFVLKLRESLIKSLKITVKKIIKSSFKRQKTINSPKNSFWKKQLCKEWFARAIAHPACADDNNNNSHLFSLLSVSKFKSFHLNLRYKTHGQRFIMYCWVMHALGRRLRRIANFKRTQGKVYWHHQYAQWEYEAHSSYCIWIGEYSSHVIKNNLTEY